MPLHHVSMQVIPFCTALGPGKAIALQLNNSNLYSCGARRCGIYFAFSPPFYCEKVSRFRQTLWLCGSTSGIRTGGNGHMN